MRKMGESLKISTYGAVACCEFCTTGFSTAWFDALLEATCGATNGVDILPQCSWPDPRHAVASLRALKTRPVDAKERLWTGVRLR